MDLVPSHIYKHYCLMFKLNWIKLHLFECLLFIFVCYTIKTLFKIVKLINIDVKQWWTTIETTLLGPFNIMG